MTLILSSKEKEEHKHTKVHHHSKSVKKKERAHDKGSKLFTYPHMDIKEVKSKSDEGFTFKSAQEGDYKNKDLKIVTIKLPKLGFIPFVMRPPASANTLDDGTKITPPASVAKSSN